MSEIILDIETDGLHSITNRITCISFMNIDNLEIKSFCGKDEKEILINFWNMFNENDTLVTYNGDGFDIPFIIKRSLILNIPMKRIINKLDLR